MKNQELLELTNKIIAIVEGVGIKNTVFVEARAKRYSAGEAIKYSYFVSIFHSGAIHQYQKDTAHAALKEATRFAIKYKDGGFDAILNTYTEDAVSK